MMRQSVRQSHLLSMRFILFVIATSSSTIVSSLHNQLFGVPFYHHGNHGSIVSSRRNHNPFRLLRSLRGGAGKPSSPSKKKKTIESTSTSSTYAKTTPESSSILLDDTAIAEEESDDDDSIASASAKKIIADALHEKDAAEALGDAIRDRADLLRADFERYDFSDNKNPFVQSIGQSVSSVGWALGTSDRPGQRKQRRNGVARGTGEQEDEENENDEDEEYDTGGVEASTQSVLVKYFLKSHGGAYAFQSVCSLLSVVSGLGALLLPYNTNSNDRVKLVLMRRCLVLALAKHVAGLLAATSKAAGAIPHVGLSKARLLLQQLAVDPVSQYAFYTVLVLAWLPIVRTTAKATSASAAAATTALSLPWWWSQQPLRVIPLLLLGPILLREVVSCVLVVSDVLVLWTTAGRSQQPLPPLLRAGQAVIDAVMSLLVTPQLWRNATAANRQALLAKLVSKTSLALEVCVGVFLLVDVVMEWLSALFTAQSSASLQRRIIHLLCLRLYLRFLLVRRRKIVRLAATIRGGAHHVPVRILDALLDPCTAMGLPTTAAKTSTLQGKVVKDGTSSNNNAGERPSWMDWTIMALGLDES